MIEKMDLFGRTCPALVVSQVHYGHYQTFLEMLRTQEMENLSQVPQRTLLEHHGLECVQMDVHMPFSQKRTENETSY